jgi:hypothetical protein
MFSREKSRGMSNDKEAEKEAKKKQTTYENGLSHADMQACRHGRQR